MLEPLIKYPSAVTSDTDKHEYLKELNTSIDIGYIKTLLNDSSEMNNIRGIGLTFSTYNPQTNCFKNTNACESFEIIILLKPEEAKVITEETKMKIKTYIDKAIEKTTHNNHFKAACYRRLGPPTAARWSAI